MKRNGEGFQYRSKAHGNLLGNCLMENSVIIMPKLGVYQSVNMMLSHLLILEKWKTGKPELELANIPCYNFQNV
jgi:hypothetical protein